jgi:hypothetical protein
MRTLYQYLTLIVCVFPLSILAQDRSGPAALNEDMIAWSASRRLTWNDYKASPDPASDAAASTTTFLTISYNISSSDFSYKIESKFSKFRSWGLFKTSYILSHEQGHFDIAEIFARKLHMRMMQYHFDRHTYQKDLKKIYQEILDEKAEMQEAYDEDTNHSINRDKQYEWLKRIEKMLKDYEDYADY